MNFSSCVT